MINLKMDGIGFFGDDNISKDLRRRDSNKIFNNIICLQRKIFVTISCHYLIIINFMIN